VTQALHVDDVGRLRVLRLNRPERKNALTGELIQALTGAIRAAATDDDVWALAITGNGDAFCSGLDLDQSGDDDTADESDTSDGGDRERDGVHNLSVLMRVDCEKPIVAGVNGVAVGLGVSLAMNADIRIAAPNARFHPGYARVATSPDGGLTWTLTRAVGYERAMRFLLEQRMVSATEALALGLVSEIADDDFDARLLEYGTILASVAPLAARQTKRMLVRADQPPDLAAHLGQEIELALHGLASDDSAEAVRAMVAKEPPRFTGR
jgi:2-(1,2-epoxy-1,2-dihydrophenyl)acetyl-CoA isomerase